MAKLYTCPDCGREYEVKPKRCVCETDHPAVPMSFNRYLAAVEENEISPDIDNEMMSAWDIFQNNCIRIDPGLTNVIQGEEIGEDNGFGDHTLLLIMENQHMGIETTDTYSRTYYHANINCDSDSEAWSWSFEQWTPVFELIHKKTGTRKFQRGGSVNEDLYVLARTIDHDHCAECMKTFSENPGHEQEGYYNEDEGWMCKSCFKDLVTG